jgi:hypothetical protein
MGRFEINSRKLSTFEVAVNRVVSQTLAENLTLYMSRDQILAAPRYI